MPYVYEEGVVPVPANHCTRCGGLLEAGEGSAGSTASGWFTISTLDATTWLYGAKKEEPSEGERKPFSCGACQRTFHLYEGA